MKKQSKRILLIIGVIVIVLAALAAAYYFFVMKSPLTPSAKELAELTEVPETDFLQAQAEIEQEILADYSNGSYTIDNPYIIIDPYDFNPLSALIIFDSDTSSDITVTIEGTDEYSTIEYTKSIDDTHYEIPVIGLYAGKDNQVTITDGDGNSVQLTITTEPLPSDFDTHELITSQPDKMEPGLTLLSKAMNISYSALVDCYGEIRGYVSQTTMVHGSAITLLENGHMISSGNEYLFGSYNKYTMIEFNWLGKIFTEYQMPNGIHHDVEELPDGNLLVVSNPADAFAAGTVEDVVIVVDRETGEVIKEYDYSNIVDNTLVPFTNGANIQAYGALNDWLHINSATYDKEHNMIIASARTQSYVVAIDADSLEIQWVLGADELFEDSYMKDYQLTPVGDDFEIQWCQHEVQIMPDMDDNSDTMDIILFDNGQYRSTDMETVVAAEDNYSRGVQFRINMSEMTVEQIWQYGKERGIETYSAILGDANYYELTGNRMMCYGGQVRDGDGNSANNPSVIYGNGGKLISRIIEVTEDREIVFELTGEPSENDYSGETYQATRIPLYVDSAYDYQLGDITGERLGTTHVESQVADISEMPEEFTDTIDVQTSNIYQKDNRLIISGTIKGTGDMNSVIGICNVAFISKSECIAYETRIGSSGAFLASIDLSELPKGEYMITYYGEVTESSTMEDAEFVSGHIKSGYKITIE